VSAFVAFVLAALLLVPAVLVAIPVHEMGHAAAAYFQGDRSVRYFGYFTLDPRRFLDPLGVIAVFIALVGWGRRVPVQPNRINTMRQRLVHQLGGPAANLLVAIALGAVWRFLTAMGLESTLTLSSGLQADYAALIEKRNLASLRFTKEASVSAQQLLAVCHDCYDALVATGFSKYIIGSMAAPVRWILHMGGLPSDKQGGIADLQTTAEHGHYLAPFARILLSIAYVREKDKSRALQLLTGLRQEFPGNTLFPREIAHLQSSH